MTDPEMMALDAKLVEISSQRRKAPNKKEKKGAKENIVNLENGVLEVYAGKCPGNTLAYRPLQPLLQLVHKTTDEQVGERAQDVVNALARSSRGAPAREVDFPIDVGERLQLLEDIHAACVREPPGRLKPLTRLTSTASTSLLRYITAPRSPGCAAT